MSTVGVALRKSLLTLDLSGLSSRQVTAEITADVHRVLLGLGMGKVVRELSTGGKLQPPEHSVVSYYRATTQIQSRDEKDTGLGGFVDIPDELVYSTALRLFGVRLECVLEALQNGDVDSSTTLLCAKLI